MLDIIGKLFRDAGAAPAVPEPDGRLALAALLVEAARQDGSYDAQERAAILRVLAAEFGLDAGAADALCQRGEAAQDSAVDLFRFTHALKQHTAFEERARMIEHLWEIALADGERDDAEDALIRKLCGLLGVTDQQSAFARQRVAERLDAAE